MRLVGGGGGGKYIAVGVVELKLLLREGEMVGLTIYIWDVTFKLSL